MAFVLALARGTCEVDRGVRVGRWPKYEGLSLAAATLGIIGYGGIGRAIAHRARAFGMEVLVSDPIASVGPDAKSVGLDELATSSRFVVLACPLTPDTHHLVGPQFLEAMRSDAFVVNVARGPVVDEAALVAALASGRISGAALDVFENEPLPAWSQLRSMDHVILGAHNGSNTRQGVERASACAVDYLLDELRSSMQEKQ